MLTKLYTISAVAIALMAIQAACRYQSAFVLRNENQNNYASRRGTNISGVYIGGYWQATPSRAEYPEFRGGGMGTGK
jgi:hypothetical protein